MGDIAKEIFSCGMHFFMETSELLCKQYSGYSILRRRAMVEKRKHRRFEMELPVTLRTKGRLVPAATVNLSLGGVCLLTDYNEQIELGDAEIVVDLDQTRRDIPLRGKVLRFEKGIGQKVAIQFTDSSAGSQKSLEVFLSDQKG